MQAMAHEVLLFRQVTKEEIPYPPFGGGVRQSFRGDSDGSAPAVGTDGSTWRGCGATPDPTFFFLAAADSNLD